MLLNKKAGTSEKSAWFCIHIILHITRHTRGCWDVNWIRDVLGKSTYRMDGKMLKPLRIHYLYYVRRFDVQTLNFLDTGLPEERCDTITNSMSRKSRKVFGGKEFFANFTSSPLI